MRVGCAPTPTHARSHSGADKLMTGKVIDQNGVPVRELRISGSRKSVDLATSLIRKCWTVPKDSASASAADFEPGECSESK